MSESIVLSLVLVAAVGEPQTCPEPFVELHGGCYYFHTELTTYNRSVEVCHELGATLAQIDSAEEEQALTRHIEGIHLMYVETSYLSGKLCRERTPSPVTLKVYPSYVCRDGLLVR